MNASPTIGLFAPKSGHAVLAEGCQMRPLQRSGVMPLRKDDALWLLSQSELEDVILSWPEEKRIVPLVFEERQQSKLRSEHQPRALERHLARAQVLRV
jgi:hypothetical protein